MEFLLERDRSTTYLTDHIKSIYDSQSASDMVILAERSEFKVHRSVLAAASQFFSFLLKDQQTGDLVVSMVDYR